MKKTIPFLFVFLLLVSLVNAVPPFESEEFKITSTGLVIAYPEIRLVKVGSTIELDFHVFNGTDGLPITNATADCYFQLNNNTGNHLHEINITDFAEPFDFTVTINGNNFTQIGYYFYTFQCNTSSAGGFVEENFRVTTDGTGDSEAESIKLIAALIGVLILAGIFVVLAFKLEEEHYILKIFFIFMTLITLTIIPQLIIKGVYYAGANILNVSLWAYRFFVIYLSIYIIYNWARNSERFLRWFGKQK